MVSRRGTHGTGVINDLALVGQSALRRGISKVGSRNKEREFRVSKSDLVRSSGNRLRPDPKEPLT